MSGERTEMRRPAVKMAAAIMPAAEMVSAATMMPATVMTTAPTATVTASMTAAMTTTASRNGKVRHGQHRCEDNRGNSQCDL
jgi:hypothetical protein